MFASVFLFLALLQGDFVGSCRAVTFLVIQSEMSAAALCHGL